MSSSPDHATINRRARREAARRRSRRRTASLLICSIVGSTFTWAINPNLASAASGTINVSTFLDRNGNGVFDAVSDGVVGLVTVKAYDSTGANVGTIVTDKAGAGVLTIAAAASSDIRLEFESPYGPDGILNTLDDGVSVRGLRPTLAPNETSLVRFVVIGDTAAQGYVDPLLVSAVANPKVIAPILFGGPYDSTKIQNRVFDYLDHELPDLSVAPQGILSESPGYNTNGVGAVYGSAIQRSTGRLYNAATAKRHSALGPGGINAIYRTDSSGTAGVVATTAVNTDPSGLWPATRNLDELGNGTNASHDSVVYGLVGKVGWGDIEVDETGDYLWATNMGARTLVRFEFAANGDLINPVSFSVPGNLVCTNGVARPSAVTPYRGKIYVGWTCTGELGGTLADVKAEAWAFDPVTSTWGSTPAVSTPLNFRRGNIEVFNHSPLVDILGNMAYDRWHVWSDTNSGVKDAPPGWKSGSHYSQPIFSDISFLPDGDMVLGFRDRNGDMWGPSNYSPNPADMTTYVSTVTGGDMLRAGAPSVVGGAWTMESGGVVDGVASASSPSVNEGPGGDEFFGTDWFSGWSVNYANLDHSELFLGSMLVGPDGDLMATAFDPAQWIPNSGGVQRVKNDGALRAAHLIFFDDNPALSGVFGKANGVGDIVAVLEKTTAVEIGNRVWIDADADGIQDAGEASAAGVTVTLHNAAGVVVGTAITAADGTYRFSSTLVEAAAGNGDSVGGGLVAGSQYTIRLSRAADFAAGGPLSGLSLTTANAVDPLTALDDEVDSDAVMVGSVPTITPAIVDPVENRHDYDFGFVSNPTLVGVGDYVWVDTDRDGIQDAAEPPVVGATVEILNSSGTVVGTTATDVAGHYSFGDLAIGTYTLRFSNLPAGYTVTVANAGADDTVDSDPGAALTITGVVLDPGLNPLMRTPVTGDAVSSNTDFFDPTRDLGLVAPLFAVGDYTWTDENHNGVQDPGETPVAGMKVELLNPDGSAAVDYLGSPVPFATTDAAGHYVFDGLVAGDYRVRFSNVPATFALTSSLVGSSANDSNPVPATGVTPTFTLSSSSPNLRAPVAADGVVLASGIDPTIDAGIFRLFAVGDYTWIDTDGDGTQDAGEPAVAGVSVTLLNPDGSAALDAAGNPVATVSTNAAGHYAFDNLLPGNYQIRFGTPAGYLRTPALAGAVDADSDASVATGLTSTFTLGGASPNMRAVVAGDGTPVASLINPTIDAGFSVATTGHAVAKTVRPLGSTGPFTELAQAPYPGDFEWQISYTNTGNVALLDVVLTDDTAPVCDATFDGRGGTKTVPGLARVEPGTTVTYTCADLDVLADKVNTVTAHASGADVGTPPADVADPAAVELTYSLGDYVWFDADHDGVQDAAENGIPAVVVQLIAPTSETVLATTSTDASGHYSFAGLRPGGYRVRFELPDGFRWTEPGVGDAAHDMNPTFVADDDAFVTTPIITISGSQAAPGSYNPLNLTDPTIDAGVWQPYSLGDFVWSDTDLDGQQDAAEPVVAGVHVALRNADGTAARDAAGVPVPATVTDATGRYAFRNLDPGSYLVSFTLPNGAVWTKSLTGATASDHNPTYTNPWESVIFAPVTIVPGQSVLVGDNPLGLTDPTIDAGIVPVASLGDYVWLDEDRDGLQDASEEPISGVTVTLLNADGTPARDAFGALVAPTSTDATGLYGFVGLMPGRPYVVQFTRPAQLSATGQNTGDDTLDSDADPVSGRAAAVTLAAGEHNPTIDAGFYLPVNSHTIAKTVRRAGSTDAFTELARSPHPGDFEWQISYTNTGETALLDVVITDDTAPVCDATFDGRGGTKAVPGLARVEPGATVTYTCLDVDVTADKVNTATAHAGSSDRGLPPADVTDPAAVELTYSLGDYVWFDADHDGVQDSVEHGVNGVKVELLDSVGTVVASTLTANLSGRDGAYQFAGLRPGDFKVRFTLPSGFEWTKSNVGADTTNMDPVYVTDTDATVTTATITIAHSQAAPVSGNPLGLTDPTIDAGIWAPHSLGDYVWIDANLDGLQTPGELPVADVAIRLLNADKTVAHDADGAEIPATTTDAAGRYAFRNLDPGSYLVEFSLPNGAVWTLFAAGGVAVDHDPTYTNPWESVIFAPVTIVPGQSVLVGDNPLGLTDPTIDAGIVPVASLGDYVWFDDDRNGVQDSDEDAVGGAVVSLYSRDASGALVPAVNAFGVPVTSTRTAADGSYRFDELMPGVIYVVQFQAPDGTRFTIADAPGVVDSADSDADSFTGMSHDVVLGVGERNPTIDAGIFQPFAVGDYTWIDENHDGAQSDGEPAIGGITVELFDAFGDPARDSDGELIAAVTTDAAGHYVFDNLGAGMYQIRFSGLPATYSFTVQHDATAGVRADSNANQATGMSTVFEIGRGAPNMRAPIAADKVVDGSAINPTIDAGIFRLYAVGDYTWIDTDRDGVQDSDEKPVANITVELLDAVGTVVASTKTDAVGHYVFDGLVAGDYQVRFGEMANHAFTLTGSGHGATGDSDASFTTGLSEVFNLSSTSSAVRAVVGADGVVTGSVIDPTLDAGFFPVSYDLALMKVTRDAKVDYFYGDDVAWDVLVANQGNVDSFDFVVSDALPSGMEFVSADNGGTFDKASSTVTWKIPNLAPGKTLTLGLVTKAAGSKAATFRNWAEISSDSSGDWKVLDDDSTPDSNTGRDTTDPNDAYSDRTDRADVLVDVIAGDEDDNDLAEVGLRRRVKGTVTSGSGSGLLQLGGGAAVVGLLGAWLLERRRRRSQR